MSVAPSANVASDHSLLMRIKAGEDQAATDLYRKYAEQLKNLAWRNTSANLATRLDPDDIVQSVFRTFFRQVVNDHYEVPEGKDLWNLFLVIALNKIRRAANFHKAAKRDVRQTRGNIEDAQVAGRIEGDDNADLTVLNMVIEELLGEMPENSQQMIRMRIEGHEVAEIAQATGRSKRSVERVLQRFREELKGRLDDSNESESDRQELAGN